MNFDILYICAVLIKNADRKIVFRKSNEKFRSFS